MLKRIVVPAAFAALFVTAAIASAQSAGGVWQGAYSAEQATAGKATYDAKCAICHGATLGGGDSAPALTGVAFLNNWNGTSAKDLFDRIHDTMPADAPGSLSGPRTAEIIAYIFQTSGFPAGANPLPTAPPPLEAVKIVATKPAG
jgi:S-disulfanyl-L-cysteine oxidoreductase SoxD